MRAIKSRDSKIELQVRRMVFHAGFRYRLHGKGLPGKPDLVFQGRKKVIFVHGCFWHCHPASDCPISHKPSSNTPYWHTKLERTIARDKKNLEALALLGWESFVIWECQMKDDTQLLAALKLFLSKK